MIRVLQSAESKVTKIYFALGAAVVAAIIGYGAWKQSLSNMDFATKPGMGDMNMGQTVPGP